MENKYSMVLNRSEKNSDTNRFFRVIVTGSRKEEIGDWLLVEKTLNKLSLLVEKTLNKLLIVHGGQSEIDTVVSNWATRHGVIQESYPVSQSEWDTLGKYAEPKRNKRMLDSGCQLVLSFKGGDGTLDMVIQALNREIPVEVVQDDN